MGGGGGEVEGCWLKELSKELFGVCVSMSVCFGGLTVSKREEPTTFTLVETQVLSDPERRNCYIILIKIAPAVTCVRVGVGVRILAQ